MKACKKIGNMLLAGLRIASRDHDRIIVLTYLCSSPELGEPDIRRVGDRFTHKPVEGLMAYRQGDEPRFEQFAAALKLGPVRVPPEIVPVDVPEQLGRFKREGVVIKVYRLCRNLPEILYIGQFPLVDKPAYEPEPQDDVICVYGDPVRVCIRIDLVEVCRQAFVKIPEETFIDKSCKIFLRPPLGYF